MTDKLDKVHCNVKVIKVSNNFKQQTNTRAYCLGLTFLLGLFGLWSWLTESVVHELLLKFIEDQLGYYYPDATGLAFTIILISVGLFIRSRCTYMHEFELLYTDLVKRLKLKFILLGMAVVLLSAVSYGLFSLYKAAPTTEQETLLIDLSTDDVPSFIQLKKVSFSDAKLSKQISFAKNSPETSSNKLHRYTPILSSSDPSRPIKFVELYTSASISKHKSQRAKLSGYVNLRPLPAVIQGSFEASGLKFASPVYVVSDSVFDVAPYFKWAAIIAGFLSLLLFIRLLRTPTIHRRKLQNSWDHQRGYSKNKDVSKDVWPWSSQSAS